MLRNFLSRREGRLEVNEGGAVAAKAVEGRRVRDAAAPAAIRSISRRLISLCVIF